MWTHYKNIVDLSRKTYERGGIETIVDNDGILWLDEKHIEEGLDHKNLQEIAMKYYPNHKKHRYDLVDEPKQQCNIIFLDKKLAVKVISDCRSVHKFRTRIGFKQYDDFILRHEQSVLTKITNLFEGKNMQTNIMF